MAFQWKLIVLLNTIRDNLSLNRSYFLIVYSRNAISTYINDSKFLLKTINEYLFFLSHQYFKANFTIYWNVIKIYLL